MFKLEDFADLSIYEMLENTVNEFPNNMAVIDKELELTYADLKQSVDAFSSVLVHEGFEKGDRIGLMLPNGFHYVIAFYAIQRLGGTVVQVNPSYQTSELEHILNDATPKWFICGRDQEEKIEKIENFDNVFVIYTKDINGNDQLLLKEKIAELPKIEIDTKEDIAVLQYTGGTTGKSKGVMLTHFNIICNIHQSGEFFASVLNKGEERILGIAPLIHAMSMSTMNNCVRIAATLIILEKFNATQVLELIAKYKPTYMLGSPTMYIALLNHPDIHKYDLSCLKICISGSAPLPVEIIKRLVSETGAAIFEGYGLSEATTSALRTPFDNKSKIGSVGIPIPFTEVKIVDLENGIDEMPTGESGEIIIKGPQVMKGYWNNLEETSATIRDGWLYTGDIGVKDEDGYYYIVGRKKDMVIAGGFNIYPVEVEEVLYQHPSIEETCVFGVPDEYLGERLLAVVVLKKGVNISAEELLGWCEDKLARYKVPRAIEFRDTLPKTIVGKILRRTLVDEYKEKIDIL